VLIRRNVNRERVLVLMPVCWRQFFLLLAYRMMLKIGKILLAILLSLTFTISLWKIILCVHTSYFDERNLHAVDNWLDANELGAYKKLFKDMGEYLALLLLLLLLFFKYLISLTQISIFEIALSRHLKKKRKKKYFFILSLVSC
jgi:hypothetical protein